MNFPEVTLEQALGVVRYHQALRFAQLLQEVPPASTVGFVEAEAALRKHGDIPIVLKISVEAAVLLSGMLTVIDATAPPLEIVRQNIIAGISKAVGEVNPVLALIAQGTITTVGQTVPQQPCQNTKEQPAKKPKRRKRKDQQ